jgi:hypothetical protein
MPNIKYRADTKTPMTKLVAERKPPTAQTKTVQINVAKARSEAGAFLGSGASRASFSKNPQERSIPKVYIYIYIIFFLYIAFILKKTCRKTN